MSESIGSIANQEQQSVVGEFPEDSREIKECCMRTVQTLSANNAMMVCSECKQIIKCFHDQRSYKNYIIFCEGRSREIKKGFHDGQFIVVFNSYDA